MKLYHRIKNIRFQEDRLIINIDNKIYSFELSKISKRLLNASKEDRNQFIISASGYGIHWPTLEEDLSIDALLGIIHKPLLSKKQLSF
jgi:hypothetical protein